MKLKYEDKQSTVTEANNYIIKLIDLEKYKKDNGFYEVNFHPDRNFDSEVHVLLYKSESWGNYHYFQYFKAMDEQNIKVIIYCIFPLFPLASIIGHEVRMHKVDGNLWYRRLSNYGLDYKKAWAIYDIHNSKNKYWSLSNMLDTDEIKRIKIYETGQLAEEAYKRPMYMGCEGYNIFMKNDFPKKCIFIQCKKHWYGDLKEKINNLNLKYILGLDEQIQLSIIKNFQGSDYLLTYQILMSIYNKVEYIGIAGSASLFASVPTINALFISDDMCANNVNDNSLFFKLAFNKKIFNKETAGFLHLQRMYETHKLASSWMWSSLEYLLTSWEPSKEKPSVEIS